MLTPSQKTPDFMSIILFPAQFLLLAAISLSTSVAYAEMYKWVDAEGKKEKTWE
ncbi:MAG: hypothetical protein ACI909_000381 [Planctomycetota bacterium]|jgi:hypothetical protein